MSFEKKEPFWTAAAEAATTSQNAIPTEWIYGQWFYETGSLSADSTKSGFNFGKFTQTQNNGNPNSDSSLYYKIFSSIDEYATFFGQTIATYPNIGTCSTIDEYVQCLTDNKYNPETDLTVLANGIRMALNGEDVKNTKGTGYSSTAAAAVANPAKAPDFGDKVEAAVKNHLDLPYVMGGDGVTSIDCGMFTMLVYGDVGIDLANRCADEQYRLYKDTNTTVSLDNAKKGDLMFFQNTYVCDDAFDNVTHVGIFLGGDTMAHAGNPSKIVAISELGDWFTSHFYCCGHSSENNSLVGRNGKGTSTSGGSAGTDSDCTVKSAAGCVVVQVKPPGKTFCEPIHQDMVTVTGNVPKVLANAAAKAAAAVQTKTDDGLYTVSLDKIQTATGMDFEGFFSDKETIAKSQQIFDATKFASEVKPATKGKPVNNTDPYPVDLKIEELETHQPRVKIQELKLPKPDAADIVNAKAALVIGDKAEKRIVKLENMLSTLYRYVFALGSRVHINCVYYGGQDRYAKYKAIRCLKDNRIEDGAQMQIDQCLTCTRYEPIIGQTYEILDEDIRPSLGLVLDDVQMSYSNMAQEIDFTRTEQYHTEKTAATQDMSLIKVRNAGDKDFDKAWKEGLKMNWALTPVEQQKPSINWKQDINDTDKPKGHLASYQQANAGSSIGNGINGSIKISPGQMKAVMKANYDLITHNENSAIQTYIDEAVANASDERISSTIDNMSKYGFEDKLVEICNSKNLDPLLMLSIIAVESSGDADCNADGVMQTIPPNAPGTGNAAAGIENGTDIYLGKIDMMGTDNPVIACTAYNSWCPDVIPPDKETILWVNMLGTYIDQWPSTINKEYFGKVCVCYHKFVDANIMKTKLDQTSNLVNLRFPFNDIDFAKVTFVQDYDASVTENGATISTIIGLAVSETLDVYAAGVGTVTSASNNSIVLNITDTGDVVTYYGLNSMSVAANATTDKDTLIGNVASELKMTIQDSSGAFKDPKVYYGALNGKQGLALK